MIQIAANDWVRGGHVVPVWDMLPLVTREHLTEEEHSDLTPQVPILQMTLDQVSSYYAQLMKKLLEMEAGGGKPGRLWAGKDGKPPAGERQ